MNVGIWGCGNIGISVLKDMGYKGNQFYLFDVRCPQVLNEMLSQSSIPVTFQAVDAMSEEAVSEATIALKNSGVQLDVLLVTVGTSTKATPITDYEQYVNTFELNVFGCLIPIRAALNQRILAERARIIVVDSTSGHFASDELTAYCSSKWVLENFCSSLRSELHELGVSVDVICPKTIQNVCSEVFVTESGISVSSVSKKIIQIIHHPRNKSTFVPVYFRVLHIAERLCPIMLDKIFALPKKSLRAKKYRQFQNDTVLITGASSGLGRELALIYGKHCTRLYIVARQMDKLNEIRNILKETTQCKVIPIQADLSTVEGCDRVLKQIDNAHINVLINNAGVKVTASICDIDMELMRKSFQTNFYSHVYLTASLIRDGHKPNCTVNILSTTAIAGRQNMSPYSAPKAAMWCFTRALRRKYGTDMSVVEVIPASFSSNLFANEVILTTLPPRGEDAHDAKLQARILTSEKVAQIVYDRIQHGKEIIPIPSVEANMFIAFEAIAPKLFRKVFK